ncbi:DNA helicase [Tanacetum coccineum]|uniref:DNA helicase n=1 Tax=Tanacetum coccineum TaxID=301880 RepID=A0ABQ4YIB7_9ASTR
MKQCLRGLHAPAKIWSIPFNSNLYTFCNPHPHPQKERRRSKTFAKWLLDVGDGEIGESEEEEDQDSSWITILPEFLVDNDETSLSRLINFIYDDTTLNIPTAGSLQETAIMCLNNATKDDVNAKILSNIEEYHVPTPNESPLHAVHSHGSDEGSLKLNELTNLVTKLSERIGVLEDDLKKTKQTYSSAFTKLILKIKKLESKVKTGKARKRARVVLSEDEEDDSSKHGRINEDPNTYFAQDDEVVHDQDTAAERQLKDSTAGITVSTAPIHISTARESPSTAGRVVYGRRS